MLLLAVSMLTADLLGIVVKYLIFLFSGIVQMAEFRFEKPDYFLFHDQYEPHPKGITIVCKASKPFHSEHRNSIDARKGLRAIARQCGGNALLDVHSNYTYGPDGHYTCWGVPALYAKQTPKGKFTKEQLEAGFHEIRQEGELTPWQKRIWASAYLIVIFILCKGLWEPLLDWLM